MEMSWSKQKESMNFVILWGKTFALTAMLCVKNANAKETDIIAEHCENFFYACVDCEVLKSYAGETLQCFSLKV